MHRIRPQSGSKALALASFVGLCALLVAGRWFALAAGGTSNTPAALSPLAAQQLETKLDMLQKPSSPTSYHPIVITDFEANSYLKFKGQTILPPSVQNPEVRIDSDGIYGVADVDFNQLSPQNGSTQDWSTQAFSMILNGKQRVSAVGKLQTANGEAKVNIQNVYIGSTQVPQVLVEWLLSNYVQTKYKVDLSKPLLLPDHVARIELAHGQATLLRSPDKK